MDEVMSCKTSASIETTKAPLLAARQTGPTMIFDICQKQRIAESFYAFHPKLCGMAGSGSLTEVMNRDLVVVLFSFLQTEVQFCRNICVALASPHRKV